MDQVSVHDLWINSMYNLLSPFIFLLAIHIKQILIVYLKYNKIDGRKSSTTNKINFFKVNELDDIDFNLTNYQMGTWKHDHDSVPAT